MSTEEKTIEPAKRSQPQEEPASAALAAQWPTRIIYSLGLLSVIIAQLGQGSWVGLATGGGLVGWVGTAVFLLIASGLIYRIYLVLRYKASLRSRKPNISGWLFRSAGWLVMLAGALGAIAVFLVTPLTLLLFKTVGDNGIGYFVVGLYAVMLAGVGWLGCLLFELSRVMGPRPSQLPAAKTPTQRKQDLGVAASIFALVLGVPYTLRLVQGEPCYGPNLTRCIASIEGGVTRPAMMPFGAAVKFETNVEDIVFLKQAQKQVEFKENPSASLLKSGHPSEDDANLPVRVVLNAAPNKKGVMLTLQVFDALGETAKFVTLIPKHAQLEASNNGKQNVVIHLPSNVNMGLQFPYSHPATQKKYILDEMYHQMRQAIASPREVGEWKIKVPRTLKELSSTSIPRGGKIDEAKPAQSCRDTLKLVRGGDNETALRPSPGSPLNRLVFLSVTDPDSYALAQVNDRIGCNADGIWAFNYPAPNGDLEIRRYSVDGKLRNFVAAKLPAEKTPVGWADVESPKVDGDKMTFSVLSIPSTGGDWKRQVYELSF